LGEAWAQKRREQRIQEELADAHNFLGGVDYADWDA
jgi:hypothetical protein